LFAFICQFEKNEKLRRKSFAAMRLAEKRGQKDALLLARLGETIFNTAIGRALQ
jgi:hypothetical protein